MFTLRMHSIKQIWVYVNSQARCFPFFTTSASFLLQMQTRAHTRAQWRAQKNSPCKRCTMTCLKIFHNKCPIVHHLYITVVIVTLDAIDRGDVFVHRTWRKKNSRFLSIVLCVFHITKKGLLTSCRKKAAAQFMNCVCICICLIPAKLVSQIWCALMS